MKYRTLAGTDIRISEIGFGLWTLVTGRWGRHTTTEATALLHDALDLGIHFFVTADVDGEGAGEELLAKAFRSQQAETVVAVKVGYDFYHAHARLHSAGKPSVQFTPEYIRLAVDKALQRLKRDRIDLLQLHDVTPEAVMDLELQGALEGLKQAGKIRHHGAALGPGHGKMEVAEPVFAAGRPSVIEHLHHLLEPAPGEAITAKARGKESQVSLIVRGPHASGLLEGRLTPETVFKPDDARAKLGTDWLRNGLKKADQFRFLTGKETGRTLAQAALLWHLAEPVVASCLPNIASREDLVEFAAAPEKNPLTAQELEHVAEIVKTWSPS